MTTPAVDRIARTLLYEGYMLYPYRPTAVKNRQRFNFGVLYPPTYASRQTGSDASSLETECVLCADASTEICVTVRFLRLADRTIGKVVPPTRDPVWHDDARVRQVDRLDVDGRILQPWQEAAECEVLLRTTVAEGLEGVTLQPFAYGVAVDVEPVRDASGTVAAIVTRRSPPLHGIVRCSARRGGDGLFVLRVVVENATPEPDQASRADVLLSSCIAAHVVFTASSGSFVSLVDPPDDARATTQSCTNVGVWPVLVGEAGTRDAVLASPIVLYDHPTIAPESPGDFFDATEMDEMLSLRILTLTEEEQREMASVDSRSHALLERTRSLAASQMMQLHGTIRSLEPVEGGAT